MIQHISDLHSTLDKGATIKVVTTLPNYVSYINRTDIIRTVDGVLEVYRANGAIVIINPQYIVMCCVIEKV